MATGRKTLPEHRGNLPPALRHLRQRLGVRQQALVEKLGVGQGRLSQYERGKTEPDFATLRWLLEGMGFDLHDLQDALDAMEGRPPRFSAVAGFGSPVEIWVSFMRLFAQMIAKELKAQTSAPKLKPRPGKASSHSGKLTPEE